MSEEGGGGQEMEKLEKTGYGSFEGPPPAGGLQRPLDAEHVSGNPFVKKATVSVNKILTPKRVGAPCTPCTKAFLAFFRRFLNLCSSSSSSQLTVKKRKSICKCQRLPSAKQ